MSYDSHMILSTIAIQHNYVLQCIYAHTHMYIGFRQVLEATPVMKSRMAEIEDKRKKLRALREQREEKKAKENVKDGQRKSVEEYDVLGDMMDVTILGDVESDTRGVTLCSLVSD